MKIYRAEEFYSVLERIAVQERTAELAAEVAHEADRTGQTETADTMWKVVRRCRVEAIKLRVLA